MKCKTEYFKYLYGNILKVKGAENPWSTFTEGEKKDTAKKKREKVWCEF